MTDGRAPRSVLAVARGTARQLLDFVLPGACVACEAPIRLTPSQGVLCGRCWAGMPWLAHPRCDRCGHPRAVGIASQAAACAWCALLPPYVRACRSACWVPAGPGGDMVRALKFGGWRAAAPAIGARVGGLDWPHDVVDERVAAVPVPLGARRLRERGYNQASL
ncbi:MAG TPA: double zinc ribbon domain-containing protein, partial [Gemmatirosa sp.]